MTIADKKYYATNYTKINSSIRPIQISTDKTVEYVLIKRNNTEKEYIVWMTINTDFTDLDLGITQHKIKAVVFSQTDRGAVETAFKKYLKGEWFTFNFGKDTNLNIN